MYYRITSITPRECTSKPSWLLMSIRYMHVFDKIISLALSYRVFIDRGQTLEPPGWREFLTGPTLRDDPVFQRFQTCF